MRNFDVLSFDELETRDKSEAVYLHHKLCRNRICASSNESLGEFGVLYGCRTSRNNLQNHTNKQPLDYWNDHFHHVENYHYHPSARLHTKRRRKNRDEYNLSMNI